MLPSGLDRTDGRIGKDTDEVTGEGGARRQEAAVHDDLLTDDSEIAESSSQGREVRAQLIEGQIAAGSVKDVVVRKLRSELAVVLRGDRLVADADQLAGQGAVRDEAWHPYSLLLRNG